MNQNQETEVSVKMESPSNKGRKIKKYTQVILMAVPQTITLTRESESASNMKESGSGESSLS